MLKVTPGAPLPLGDDTFVLVPLPFTFEICGRTFNDVFVNSNGNLTFGAGDPNFVEAVGPFLFGPPRIAGVWDDLHPGQGGVVFFTQTKNEFTVSWVNVPEFFNTGSNTFSIQLKRSANHIDLVFGNLTLIDGLTGVSCGGGITTGLEQPTDLSSLAPRRINLHNTTALYELFSGSNPFDLDNSVVRFNGTTNYSASWAGSNNAPERARRIEPPFSSVDPVRFTALEPGGDLDYFVLTARAGEMLVAEVVGGHLDTVLGLFDRATGALLAVDDNAGASGLSRLSFRIPADGEYLLAVTTAPDFGFLGTGEGSGRYVLEVQLTEETQREGRTNPRQPR